MNPSPSVNQIFSNWFAELNCFNLLGSTSQDWHLVMCHDYLEEVKFDGIPKLSFLDELPCNSIFRLHNIPGKPWAWIMLSPNTYPYVSRSDDADSIDELINFFFNIHPCSDQRLSESSSYEST